MCGGLLSSINWDSGSDCAVELFSYDALRSDEHCTRFEVFWLNDAQGLVCDEALVSFLFNTSEDLVAVEYC